MSSESRRLARLLGGAVLLLLAGAFALKLLSPRRARVPSSLAGVRLGSAPTEPAGAGGRRLVFDQAATCRLGVGADGHVARITCEVDAHDSRDRLLATLRELYGEESSAHGGAHRWQGPQARLELWSAPGSLRVSLESLTASSR